MNNKSLSSYGNLFLKMIFGASLAIMSVLLWFIYETFKYSAIINGNKSAMNQSFLGMGGLQQEFDLIIKAVQIAERTYTVIYISTIILSITLLLEFLRIRKEYGYLKFIRLNYILSIILLLYGAVVIIYIGPLIEVMKNPLKLGDINLLNDLENKTGRIFHNKDVFGFFLVTFVIFSVLSSLFNFISLIRFKVNNKNLNNYNPNNQNIYPNNINMRNQVKNNMSNNMINRQNIRQNFNQRPNNNINNMSNNVINRQNIQQNGNRNNANLNNNRNMQQNFDQKMGNQKQVNAGYVNQNYNNRNFNNINPNLRKRNTNNVANNDKKIFKIGIVILILAAGYYISKNYIFLKELDFNKIYTISIDGIDGSGILHKTENKDNPLFYEAKSDVSNSESSEKNNTASSQVNLEYITEKDFLENGNINVIFSKTEKIKNGDVITVKIDYDKELAKKLKLKIKNSNFDIKVEGLQKVAKNINDVKNLREYITKIEEKDMEAYLDNFRNRYVDSIKLVNIYYKINEEGNLIARAYTEKKERVWIGDYITYPYTEYKDFFVDESKNIINYSLSENTSSELNVPKNMQEIDAVMLSMGYQKLN